MKIKYEIELDNEVIGVDSTVAKVRITQRVNGDEEQLAGAYILTNSIDEADSSISSDVATAVIETVMKIAGQDYELEKKKTRRKKVEKSEADT